MDFQVCVVVVRCAGWVVALCCRTRQQLCGTLPAVWGKARQYLEDGSLPSGWRCQRIQTSIYYFSPRGERLVINRVVWEVDDHFVIVSSGSRPEMQSRTGWRWRWWLELEEEGRSKSTI